MDSEENHDVSEPVTPSEEAQSQDSQATDKELNFRALREEKEKLKAQLEEERSRSRLYEEQLREKAAAAAPEDDDDGLEDDDWVSRKHVDKIAEKKAKALIDREFERREADSRRKDLPERLKRDFPDIDAVVTTENVDYLKKHKPHLVATLAAQKDEYLQAAAAYDMIKLYCPSKTVMEDQVKAAANSQKPGTLGNAHSGTALSHAKAFEKGLTKDLQKSLYEEMISAAKRAPSVR